MEKISKKAFVEAAKKGLYYGGVFRLHAIDAPKATWMLDEALGNIADAQHPGNLRRLVNTSPTRLKFERGTSGNYSYLDIVSSPSTETTVTIYRYKIFYVVASHWIPTNTTAYIVYFDKD